jgi:predicted nucleic acid-binding Zn ribbon protein
MPVYLYKANDTECDCDCCKQGIEVIQRVDEAPLEKCPRCGRPVTKAIVPFSLGLSRTGLDDRAQEKGMHKFKRLGQGKYEKVF